MTNNKDKQENRILNAVVIVFMTFIMIWSYNMFVDAMSDEYICDEDYRVTVKWAGFYCMEYVRTEDDGDYVGRYLENGEWEEIWFNNPENYTIVKIMNQ